MESLCRLCCSTKFVNNYLFDEENALNLKMELFLPIKMMKGDQLPQKVCNRCSCKVNDLYQFCNIAIEAQDRLRSMLLRVDADFNESMDLSITKHEVQLPIVPEVIKMEQGTQTEDIVQPTKINTDFRPEVTLKVEPKSRTPSPIKKECSMESDCCDVPSNIPSDDSDNVSLIALKKKKRGRKANTNGELLMERAPAKKGRKKKPKLKDWELIMNALPEGTAVSVIQKPNNSVKSDIVKEEFIETECKIPEKPQRPIDVKKEPNEVDAYQCCICFTQCYSRSAMLQHYRQHASGAEACGPPPPPPPPPQPMRCARCRKPVGAGAWAAHWARHWERDRRPFRCALCEKTFRDAPQILKHGQTHAGGAGGAGGAGAGVAQPLNKRFICDLCPEGFVYMRYLLSHRARAHAEAAARPLALRCAVCGRTFAHLNSLRRHLRAHSGERNYLCSVCGKALSSREHLKFHLRIHTGYKPNVCKTCGKGFVKKCNLTLHERVHSGEKPHVCSHCGKAFSQRSTLVIHERYHSGARPYACALCGRGFVAKGLLSMHLKSTCI